MSDDTFGYVEEATPSGPRILSFNQILAAPDITEDLVDVPEWGGVVKVRALTKAQQHKMQRLATVRGTVDPERMEQYMLVYGLIEPGVTIQEAEQLSVKAAGVVERILRRIMALSGMSPQASESAERNFPA